MLSKAKNDTGTPMSAGSHQPNGKGPSSTSSMVTASPPASAPLVSDDNGFKYENPDESVGIDESDPMATTSSVGNIYPPTYGNSNEIPLTGIPVATPRSSNSHYQSRKILPSKQHKNTVENGKIEKGNFPDGAVRRAAEKAARSFQSTQPKVIIRIHNFC